MAFDIVITDLMMPGMRGDDLAAHGCWPCVPICPSFCVPDMVKTSLRTEPNPWVFALLRSNPLSMETLAHLIRKALGATEEAA
jgi:hypothetical protein